MKKKTKFKSPQLARGMEFDTKPGDRFERDCDKVRLDCITEALVNTSAKREEEE
jgi:hypothetical protein